MKWKLSNKTVLTAMAALSLMLPGCINDSYDGCPTADGNGRNLMLSLRIVSQKPQTRATGHETEIGTDAERFINIDERDFMVLVFDGNGRLVQFFEPTDGRLETTTDNNTSIYKFSGPYSALSPEIQVAVLANWKSFNPDDPYTGFALDRTLLTNLYADNTDHNFTMPTVPVTTGSESWQPEYVAGSNDNHGIPMYGISEIKSVSSAADGIAEGGIMKRVLDMGTINMLRAVAKIEVIDNIKHYTQGATTEITGVSISHSSENGRYIPDATANPSWNDATTQVTNPSLPADMTLRDGLLFFSETRYMEINDNNGTLVPGERKVYAAYVPEMSLNGSTGSTDRPHLDVTLDWSTKAVIEFADYQGAQTSNPWQSLLRNHIYRYTVNNAGMGIELELEVLEWDMPDEDVWEYTDNVGVAEDGWIKWSRYADATAATVTVPRPSGSDVNAVAEATFTIDTPKGGTWHAMFRELSADGNVTPSGAFVFVDDNNQPVSEVTGPTGTKATIRVKGAYLNESGSFNYQALLVIMVETPDGRWMEADVVEGEKTNYTIIQPYM